MPARRGLLAVGPRGMLALGGAAAAGLCIAHAAIAGGIDLTPTLSLLEEYSTNIDLEPEGEEESGWITSVTPGARLRAEGRRGMVGLDAGLTFRHQTAGDDEGLNLDVALAGVLDAELSPGLLFLEGGASVSRQTLSTEETAAASNQETVQVYSLSPVLRWRAGRLAVGELRYIFDQVLVSGPDASDETGHTGALTLSGGEEFQRLRWTLGGRTTHRFRSDDGDITRNDVELANEYALTRSLHAIGAVGYQTFDDEEALDFQSPSWRAGFRYAPNRRLDLAVDYGLRDERYSPAVRLRYEVGPRTNLFAAYAETLGTAQERLAGTLGFIAIDPETGEFIDDRAGTPFDPRSDPFDIDDETVRLKLFTLLLSHDWRRMTAVARASIGNEEEVSSGDEEDVLSLDLGLDRRLSRRTSLQVGAGYIGTRFEDGQEDHEYYLSTGVRHRLGRSLSALAGYSYRWQDSDDPLDEFEEHRVGVGLYMEF